eukprot:4815836-Amphidinium_carterae.6
MDGRCASLAEYNIPPWFGPSQLLFDGACEPGDGVLVTCGAVLFDSSDGSFHVFSVTVEGSLLGEWLAQGKRQLGTEAELLPVLLAKHLWGPRLVNQRVLVFVDSKPPKHSLVSGSSFSQACDDIVRANAFEEAFYPC